MSVACVDAFVAVVPSFVERFMSAPARFAGTPLTRLCPDCAGRGRANQPTGCHALWLSAGPAPACGPTPSFPFLAVWFSGIPRENNKRLERGKGDYMNLSTLICLEIVTALLTIIAVVAIIFGEPQR
jgi:hypothetical protein